MKSSARDSHGEATTRSKTTCPYACPSRTRDAERRVRRVRNLRPEPAVNANVDDKEIKGDLLRRGNDNFEVSIVDPNRDSTRGAESHRVDISVGDGNKRRIW